MNRQPLSAFFHFLFSHPRLRLNFFLTLLLLLFLPAKNHYYHLVFPSKPPVVRAHQLQLLPTSTYPVNFTNVPAPYLTAKSALVVDVDTKSILYQKNPDLQLLPASTTKIMTALIVLETYPLDQIITITSVNGTGQTMELELGERITVENLLYGLLVQSGNDAAIALAQNHPQGEDAFINQMNQKAQELHLYNTQFTNAAGLDAFGHYTTTHDLSLLAAHAMQNPTIKKMVSTIGITVSDVDNTITHELETINQLLGEIPGLSGIKTGWTELAGECLVAFTNREGKSIITIILASQDRFGETQQLIDWAFTHHQWQSLPPATHQ